jgi:Arc/MetJ-type ribon-helix-helix transcriptional regulator
MNEKITTVNGYLRSLKKELKGEDPSLIVDAMDDAEEFLEESLSDLIAEGRYPDRKSAIKKAVRMLGSPRSFAREYLKADRERKSLKRKKKASPRRSPLGNTVGVLFKGRTYLNFIYLMLLFPVGLIYFIYIITVASVGLGLLITIIGIPILILFLISVYGMAWAHGRMTELMLGIRMPSKRRKLRVTGGPWRMLMAVLKDPRLYTSLLYMVMLMPIGIITFTVFFTLIVVSIALILSPIASIAGVLSGLPIGYPGPDWFNLFSSVLGFLIGWALLLWTFHLSNLTAILIGKISRALLLKR